MDEDTFLTRVAECDERLTGHESDCSRYNCWCILYLDAAPQQRAQLPELFAPKDTGAYGDRLGCLTMCIRQISRAIKSPDDVQALRLGLAAAAIIGEGIDNRDVIVSLAFLHRAAEEAGINPAPYFKEIADTALPETRKFIRGFLGRNRREIKELVDAFLPYEG